MRHIPFSFFGIELYYIDNYILLAIFFKKEKACNIDSEITHYYFYIGMELKNFSRQIFEKNVKIPNIMKIRPVRAEFSHADAQT